MGNGSRLLLAIAAQNQKPSHRHIEYCVDNLRGSGEVTERIRWEPIGVDNFSICDLSDSWTYGLDSQLQLSPSDGRDSGSSEQVVQPSRNRTANPLLKHRIRWGAFAEHLALGAGSYAGLAAVAGNQRRWQVGISGTALMAGIKEWNDWHDHKDSPKAAWFHFGSILAGASAVAAFWH